MFFTKKIYLVLIQHPLVWLLCYKKFTLEVHTNLILIVKKFNIIYKFLIKTLLHHIPTLHNMKSQFKKFWYFNIFDVFLIFTFLFLICTTQNRSPVMHYRCFFILKLILYCIIVQVCLHLFISASTVTLKLTLIFLFGRYLNCY